jgi:putative hydrolase of HD superfamily
MVRTIGSGDEGFEQFFLAAGRLKTERRRGWVKKLGMEHPESVADHSYRTALITMVYSDMKGLDTRKAMKMAILHDLPEANVGDSMPGDRPREKKILLEDAAMSDLLSGLPSGIKAEYETIWREFLAGESPEAALVHQVDKLEMGIQASEYMAKGDRPSHDFEEFFSTARAAIKDEDMIRLLRLFSAEE